MLNVNNLSFHIDKLATMLIADRFSDCVEERKTGPAYSQNSIAGGLRFIKHGTKTIKN